MTLLLDEEQNMLRDSVRDFLQAESPVAQLRHLRDSADAHGVSLPLWRKSAHMGFAGLLVPGSHGGLALGAVEMAVIMEEIGRVLAPTPFLSTSVLAASVLTHAASQRQQALYLPALAAGDELLTLAIDEGIHHRPEMTEVTASARHDRFLLNGRKTMVLDGHIADHIIVLARTSDKPGTTEGMSFFIVPHTAPGLAVERTPMIDNHNAARVAFYDVEVNQGELLGTEGQARTALAPVLDTGRTAIAAELLGISAEVLDRTVAYLKERTQFGRRIGEFQALQHRAARMHCEVELLRAAVAKAAREIADGGARAGFFASVAKSKAGRVARLCTQEAIQMHGGMGMTDELEIGFFFKRARVLDELLGNHRFHADCVARLTGY